MQYIEQVTNIIKNKKTRIFHLFFLCTLSYITYVIIEIGNCENITGVITMRYANKYVWINIVTIIVFLLLLIIFFNKLWISGIVLLTFSFIISVANYFTMKFHGTPLTFQEIKNARTAANVVGNYSFEINKYIVLMLAFFLFGLCICIAEKIYDAKNKNYYDRKRIIIRDIIIIALSVFYFYTEFFSSHPFINTKYEGYLNLKSTYRQKGYVVCQVNSFISLFDDVLMIPEGYDVSKIPGIVQGLSDDKDNETPDLIFIVNETFFDPSVLFPDLKTDVDYLYNIHNMMEDDNCNLLYGHAIVQAPAGGTNRSEYEFLTSNSMNIYKTDITPMYALNLVGANSVVSVLKNRGYITLGSHCCVASNYNRQKGYSDIGFDITHFEEDFTYGDYYGNRDYMTDSSIYKNIEEWYEQMIYEGNPVMLYLMTLQNHGGYTSNNPDYDLVHTLTDFGDKNDEVDEFLTCISMSDEAFKELTDYFNNVDRQVIICMFGDHSTSLFDSSDDLSEEQEYIALRSTPLLIWSNYDLPYSGKDDIGLISENYIVPFIFYAADVNMSYYYKYQMELYEKYPVLSVGDIYIDSNEDYHTYSGEMTQDILDYFYLEYNNLSDETIEEIFQ